MLPSVKLDSGSFLIHCMPYLQNAYESYINEGESLFVNGYELQCSDIKTEPLNQYGGYGNGQEYLIVVPDKTLDKLNIAYSLFAMNANSSTDNQILTKMVADINQLHLLPRYGGSYSYDDGYSTIIQNSLRNLDYISGKAVTLASDTEITSTIPIVYLAFIFTMIGVVVIAIQLLHENNEQLNRYEMLYVLGTDLSNINRCLKQSTFVYFILPIIPGLLLGEAMVYCVCIICIYFLYIVK